MPKHLTWARTKLAHNTLVINVCGCLQEEGEPDASAKLGKENVYQHLRQVARQPADRRRS